MESFPVGDGERRTDEGSDTPAGRVWWIADIVLISLIVLPSLLLGPLGVTAYVAGRRNDASLLFGGGTLWMFSAIPVLVFLVIVVIRMLTTWPRCMRTRRWVLWARPAMIAALVVYLILPFLPLMPVPPGSFMRGFEERMERRTDVQTIRAWLRTLDPNDCIGWVHHGEEGWRNERGTRIPLPDAITSLHPAMVSLLTDDVYRPKVHLAWFAGPFAKWGLVVGGEDLPTPPSDFSLHGEYRAELCPGAYVWHDIQ